MRLGEASAAEEEARTLIEDAREHPEHRELGRAVGRMVEACRTAYRQAEDPETACDLRASASALAHHADVLRMQVAQVGEAAARLRTSVRRSEVLQRGPAETHCLKCGQNLEATHQFCPLCGTPRPLDVACTGCGAATRLPQHMLGKGWRRKTVHCSGYGDPLPPLHEGAGRALITRRSRFRSPPTGGQRFCQDCFLVYCPSWAPSSRLPRGWPRGGSSLRSRRRATCWWFGSCGAFRATPW